MDQPNRRAKSPRESRRIPVFSSVRTRLVNIDSPPIMGIVSGGLFLIAIASIGPSCDLISPTNDRGDPPCFEYPYNFRVTDFEPAWSPDGHTIAFAHGDTVNGQTGIWLVDTTGANARVFYSSVRAYSPTWSPDGQWIAFSDGGEIFKLKVNGDSLTRLTFNGHNFFPAWSSDDRWIAYDRSIGDSSGPAGIWIVNTEGGENHFVFGGGSPTWGSKNQILLGVVGTGSTSTWTRFIEYSLLQQKITATLPAVVGNSNSYPRFSPDGTTLAFTSQPAGIASETRIWIMNSDGTNLRQVTPSQGYTCDWSPTGDWLVYTNSDTVSGSLWLIRSDGSNNHQLSF